MATVASVSWNETAFLVLRLNDQHIDLPVSIVTRLSSVFRA